MVEDEEDIEQSTSSSDKKKEKKKKKKHSSSCSSSSKEKKKDKKEKGKKKDTMVEEMDVVKTSSSSLSSTDDSSKHKKKKKKVDNPAKEEDLVKPSLSSSGEDRSSKHKEKKKNKETNDKTKRKDDNSNDTKVTDNVVDIKKRKAPIFITIGPMAAGKTRLISKLAQSFQQQQELTTTTNDDDVVVWSNYGELDGYNHVTKLIDVSIDDQEGVYLKVPSIAFLQTYNNDGCATTSNTSSSNRPIKRIKTNEDTNSTSSSSSIENTPTQDQRKRLHQYIHNTTILDRINDSSNDEMRWILQRLSRQMTREEFKTRMECHLPPDGGGSIDSKLAMLQQQQRRQRQQDYIDDADGHIEVESHTITQVADLLIEAVEKCLRDNSNDDGAQDVFLPEVDLFIKEGIWRATSSSSTSTSSVNASYSTAGMGGLQAAKFILETAAMDATTLCSTAIAWGNTNTKSSDYIPALQAGEQSKRPIHFIPFLPNDDEGLLLCLPWIDIQELLHRSIRRLYTTGRYIPVRAILDACIRVDQLMACAREDMTKSSPSSTTTTLDDVAGVGDRGERRRRDSTTTTKFRLDVALAKVAGFRMNDDRTVTRLPGGRVGSGNSRGGRGRDGRYRGRGGGSNNMVGGRGGSFGRGGNTNDDNSARGNGWGRDGEGGRGRGRAGGGQFSQRQGRGGSSGRGASKGKRIERPGERSYN